MKKTAVITGATNGVGWVLANNLARRDFRLVLPCRSLERASALRAAIALHSPQAELDFILCDLADLAAVARCGEIIADRHPVVDLVVANAATVSLRRELSAQKLELTLAVNHLSHFTLLHWLLGNLYIHSRVIAVASSGARWASPDFVDDIHYQRRPYRMFQAYANSKLATIASAEAFAGLLQPRQIACVSVHPGMLATDLWPRQTPLQRLLIPALKRLYCAPPEQGAQVLEHFALAPEHNESCGYFYEVRRAPTPRAFNESFKDKLWQLSMELCEDHLPSWAL